MKEAEIFFWGVFWGISIIGPEAISWVIQIIIFVLLVMGWLYYVFNPTRSVDESTDGKARDNS